MPAPCAVLGSSHRPAYLLSWWHRATTISSGTEVPPGGKLIPRKEAARQEQLSVYELQGRAGCEYQLYHWLVGELGPMSQLPNL